MEEETETRQGLAPVKAALILMDPQYNPRRDIKQMAILGWVQPETIDCYVNKLNLAEGARCSQPGILWSKSKNKISTQYEQQV